MHEPQSSAANARAQNSAENGSPALPRETGQAQNSSLNKLQVPSSGGTNLGAGAASNPHKGDSSYAVDAILEQISKQNIVQSKQDTATVLRSPADDLQFERAESIENGIEKAAKRPSSKFNYEEFKNLAGDRKPSAHIEQSSGSSLFQAPPLVKIISENIDQIRPRKIDPRKSIDAAAGHRPSGTMEESSIIVQINDKTGINFNKDGDPILAKPEVKPQPTPNQLLEAAPGNATEHAASQLRQTGKPGDTGGFGDTKFRSMQDASVKNEASQLMPWPKVRMNGPGLEPPATSAAKEETERFKLVERDSRLILSSESKRENRERFEVALPDARARARKTRTNLTSRGSTRLPPKCC